MSGIVPIKEKLLQPNYLFALEFEEGWLFGVVIRRRLIHYAPYPLIDENGNTVDISAGGCQEEITLRDPRNPSDHLLKLPTSTNAGYPWIMHGSIGIKPEWILMYIRYPKGQTYAGQWPGLSSPRPRDGDKFAYVSYRESPYEEPTDWAELVIVPKQEPGFEFYNADPDRAHQPVLNLLFAVYWFRLLDPDDPDDAVIIGKIARREVPAAFLMAGVGNKPVSMGSELRKEWDAKPINLMDAKKLGRW